MGTVSVGAILALLMFMACRRMVRSVNNGVSLCSGEYVGKCAGGCQNCPAHCRK